jgi:hypothetical protein
MIWQLWLLYLLAGFNAAWMTFDGSRALLVGDFVTPKTGAHAGQLGPWSKAVTAVGLAPRSTPVKVAFVLYGLTTLAMLACFHLGFSWARGALLVVLVLGLWYLPIGTVLNAAAIVVLLWLRPGR